MSHARKVLVIDSNRSPESFGSRDLVSCVLAAAPQGTEIVVRRAPHGDLPAPHADFFAIVLSGSSTSCLETSEPWIGPYDHFVTKHIEKGTPILGVCYGHQTIARCLFKMAGQEVKLRKAADAELGWGEIKFTRHSPLFEGLPEKFISYHSHYEEIAEPPPGVKLFAESERCKIQAMEMADKPVFGIQFHPEYSSEQGEQYLKEKKEKGERADWLLNVGKGAKLYNEQVGKTIFGNFFRIATSRK